MNTVTPYPTFTPFPTPAGTAMVNLSPAMDTLQAGSFGPQVVQWWQMTLGPFWAVVSLGMLVIMVMAIFFAFYYKFKGDE